MYFYKKSFKLAERSELWQGSFNVTRWSFFSEVEYGPRLGEIRMYSPRGYQRWVGLVGPKESMRSSSHCKVNNRVFHTPNCCEQLRATLVGIFVPRFWEQTSSLACERVYALGKFVYLTSSVLGRGICGRQARGRSGINEANIKRWRAIASKEWQIHFHCVLAISRVLVIPRAFSVRHFARDFTPHAFRRLMREHYLVLSYSNCTSGGLG